MSTRKRKPSRGAGSGRRLFTGPQLGRYAWHMLKGAILLLLTLLPAGAVSILITWLPLMVDDPLFAGFAYLLHFILLVCDGLLFACWVLYWLLKALKELL